MWKGGGPTRGPQKRKGDPTGAQGEGRGTPRGTPRERRGSTGGPTGKEGGPHEGPTEKERGPHGGPTGMEGDITVTSVFFENYIHICNYFGIVYYITQASATVGMMLWLLGFSKTLGFGLDASRCFWDAPVTVGMFL